MMRHSRAERGQPLSRARQDPHAAGETVLLAFLVVVSLVLSRQLWFGSTLGYAIQRAPGYPLVSEASISDVRKLAQPMTLLVHTGEDAHALVPVSDYRELWQTTASLLFDALPSFPEARELTAMTEDELVDRRRRSPGVEFPLFGALPYHAWESIWVAADTQPSTPIQQSLASASIVRAGVFIVGQLGGGTPPTIEFVLRTTEGLYRYDFPGAAWPQVADLAQQVHAVRADLVKGTVPAYRPVAQAVEGWHLDPDIFVPVEPPHDLPVFMVSEVSPSADELKQWFFGDDATIHQVNDPSGGIFLQGDRQTVKANGRVEFEVIEPAESPSSSIDPVTGLRLAVAAVNRFTVESPADSPDEPIDGIPPHTLRLWSAARDLVRGSLEDLAKGFELRGYDFAFTEYYSTYPVISQPPPVEVGVNHRGLRYFARTVDRPVLLLSVIRSDMISAEDAIAAATNYVGSHFEGTQEDQRIQNVFPAYYSSTVDAERRLLDPIWVVQFASPTYGTVYIRGNTAEVVETTNNDVKTP